MMHTTLVVLAAGLGSRFGGNKQICCVGPHGECLMEYSVYDAMQAGFDRVVMILKEEMIDIVREKFAKRLESRIRVDYAVQDFSSVPAFYTVPAGRTKPLGTVHALLCAVPYLDAPFATINADDYYGRDAYSILHRMLSGLRDDREAVMVPYILGNTMSENGGVTRGICTLRDGSLVGVDETKNIRYAPDRSITSDGGTLSPDARVSMNIWGFHPSSVGKIRAYFEAFLRGLPAGEVKAECLLPIMVNDFLTDGSLSVTAQESPDRWFGLTYREDMADVAEELKRLSKTGFYPETLF